MQDLGLGVYGVEWFRIQRTGLAFRVYIRCKVHTRF